MTAIGIVLLVGVGAVAATRLAASRAAPVAQGGSEGRLAACSSTGNCVSSSSDDGTRIEPLRCAASDPLAALRAEIDDRGWEILAEQTIGPDTYLHAVATTRLMGFHDDVEFVVHDSTADLRYLVLPMRPEGTENLNEDELAALVSRDCMIGVSVVTA